MRRALLDPALRAVVRDRRPLLYAGGADARLDRPAHVRAGSALAWLGGQLVVVQDDASFFALLDGDATRDVPLPSHDGARQFDDARGNKARKLDLEAALALGDGTILAFGSGSTPARERIATLGPDGEATLVDASALYAALRAERAFAGSELNVEGAARLGERVVFFQRGNGAPVGGLAPRNATAWLALADLLAYLAGGAVPALADVEAYDLGEIDGVRLTFTDGAARGEALLYLAAAEASPDAVRDGPVSGVALGVLDPRGEGPRYALLEEGGARFTGKAEGLAFDPGAKARAYVVIDRDDPSAPAELCTVELSGPW